MSEDTIIASVRKNSKETVRVSLGKYEGYDLLNLRVWFKSDASSDERPSKSGFSLRAQLIPVLISALRDAEAEAARRGLFRKEKNNAS